MVDDITRHKERGISVRRMTLCVISPGDNVYTRLDPTFPFASVSCQRLRCWDRAKHNAALAPDCWRHYTQLRF